MRQQKNSSACKPRRQFLKGSLLASSLGSSAPWTWLSRLPRVSAAEAAAASDSVQFARDIEPLVRLLEETPREKLIEEVAHRVRDGRVSYRELLAALLLAGVRNVEPRPSVGFKFHAVLVVNSCHLASLNSADDERWLPIFWAVDYFKQAQARDVREGNWTMAPVDESRVPSGPQAEQAFVEAMEAWDVEAADVAAAGIARALPSQRVFELFARFAARDFRSIGHKAIFVANAYRTLNCIGWRYAEPVLRSLAYALLNHVGEPNPAESDLVPDRPWRENQERLEELGGQPLFGQPDDAATRRLLSVIRSDSASDAAACCAEQLAAGVSPRSLFDGLLLSAGELLMRQPGIVGLHTLTTTNAIHFLANTSLDPTTRRLLILQNAAFLPMFRAEMHRRGAVGDYCIDEFPAAETATEKGQADAEVSEIFEQLGSDRFAAARQTLAFMRQAEDAPRFMQEARRLVFLKGNDSHDYKFSSAVLEDYYHVSPAWRDRFLAASVFQLRSATERDLPLAGRILEAVG